MNIKDIKQLIVSFKRHPVRTIIIFIAFLIITFLSAYYNNFFSEKGKQAARSSSDHPRTDESFDEQHKADNRPTIIQWTEGEQSPAVNVGAGGQSNINYVPQKKYTKEGK